MLTPRDPPPFRRSSQSRHLPGSLSSVSYRCPKIDSHHFYARPGDHRRDRGGGGCTWGRRDRTGRRVRFHVHVAVAAVYRVSLHLVCVSWDYAAPCKHLRARTFRNPGSGMLFRRDDQERHARRRWVYFYDSASLPFHSISALHDISGSDNSWRERPSDQQAVHRAAAIRVRHPLSQ